MEKKYFYGIDWLRTIACIDIVLMHMITNNTYELSGFVAERMIPSFTDLTFLFMAVSAFGMCMGYYDKVLLGKVNWVDFYKKRYMKILPFFAVVVLIDVIFNHDLNSLIEAIPNLTLTRGLFQNDIGQIGVAWFLGLVFVFYMMFPFFCALISSKKRAWVVFTISILLNFVVGNFYGMERSNIVYSLMFFIAGGLVYLYRDVVVGKWYIFLPISIAIVVFYYLVGSVYACLLVSIAFLITAISMGGDSKCISFISGISMEIFLSHMVVFRVIEKMHLNTIIGNGWIQYIATCVMVLVGAGCFSIVIKKTFEKIGI